MRGAGKERRASRRVRADGASPSRDAWPGEGIAGCFGTGGAIRPEQNAPPFSWAGRGVSVSTKRAHLCGDAGRGGSPFLSLSTKAGCAGLCRQDTFPLRPGRGRGNAQGSLAAQNIRTRRACRRVRIPLGGLRSSRPPNGVFAGRVCLCAGSLAYRQMEHTSAGMQEGAASPFLSHPQRRRVRREERLQAASAIMFRPCASRTGT